MIGKFLDDFFFPGVKMTQEDYDKLMFCKRHNDYGRGSLQYDDDLSQEESDAYYQDSQIAKQYEKELPENLRWYLYQSKRHWPHKIKIIEKDMK